MKTLANGLILLLVVLTVGGCETGRNYQGEIDSLNSKVSALQNQLSAKEDEIAKLRAQQGQLSAKDDRLANLGRELSQQQAAAARAEEERKLLSRKLDEALARLSKKEQMPRVDSDLK